MTNAVINPEIEFWDCSEDMELLIWTTENEAIEMYLDQTPMDEWPETVTVYGFSRKKPNWKRFTDRMLENLIEDLDEQYGSPDGRDTIPEGMVQDATEFMQKIETAYEVWACEKKTSIQVNTMEWVKEHAPYWLEEQSGIPLYRGER